MFETFVVLLIGWALGVSTIIYAPSIPSWLRAKYEAYKTRRGSK